MADLEQVIIDALNQYCFLNIWNEPGFEVRNNIVPFMRSERSVVGTIQAGSNTIQLPTTSNYYIYSISSEVAYGLLPKDLPSGWISTDRLTNEYDVLLHTYHLSGKLCNKGFVYIYKLEDNSGFLLIVDKKMSSKFLTHAQMKDLRVTIYVDSDIINNIDVLSKNISDDSSFVERSEILSFITNPVGSYNVFIDGYLTNISTVSDIPTGSHVDVILDANIAFTFSVDLTDSTKNIGFESIKHDRYKQLIHIPKEYNPNNNVYTHNTMDIYVQVRNEDGSAGKGVYLHRCAENGVSQITHNDIAIDMYVIDSFRDYLQDQNIILKIDVRKHDKDNVLLRDKSYIDLLYTQTDQEIVDCLLGRVREDLDFWKAPNLEQSVYVNMMFDVPDIISPANIDHYVEGLGYFHTLSIICNRVNNFEVAGNGPIDYLIVNKPAVYADYKVFPMVYHNGKKLLRDNVSFTDHGSYLVVEINNYIRFSVGDIITMELFLYDTDKTYVTNVAASNNTLDIIYSDFSIFEEIDNGLYECKGVDKNYSKSYKKIDNLLGNVVVMDNPSGGKTLLFGANLYGKKILIQNNQSMFYRRDHINTQIKNNEPLVFNIEALAQDNKSLFPVCTDSNTLVFLNGRILIKDIDYSINTLRINDESICGKQVIVQNVEYLEETSGVDNILEIYTTPADEDNYVSGYVLDNQAFNKEELIIMFPSLSIFHVGGIIDNQAIYKGSHVYTESEQGTVFNVRTSTSKLLKSFVDKYYSDIDIKRLEILNDYFYGKEPPLQDIIVIPNQHKVYSVYLATIIRDLLNKRLDGINFDPDPILLMKQLGSYDHILPLDLIHKGSYDTRFVDMFPHYNKVVDDDIDIYRIISVLMEEILPEDKYSLEFTPENP